MIEVRRSGELAPSVDRAAGWPTPHFFSSFTPTGDTPMAKSSTEKPAKQTTTTPLTVTAETHHARGFGVKGYFENYDSLSGITMADPFQRAGDRTDVFVRFSTVAGNKGSMDLARDVRGFAVKFYTREGNWDLVGNNMPVFFIQVTMKFPDLVHSVKQEPDREFPQAQSAHDNFWDFISLTPEAMHMITWTMSDRAIPRSFRFMEGFGVHTFRFVNADSKSTYVKFHWKPMLGMQSVVWNEAVKINGADPDFHRRDMRNAVTSGDAPAWELSVQLFDDDFADSFDFDVLDATKLIPEDILPVKPRHRLHQRSAAARSKFLWRANYEPKSWGADGGPREDPDEGFRSYVESVSGDKRRVRPESFADHFSQARQFFSSQTPVEQAHIVDALVFELSKVQTPRIRERVVAQLVNIDTGLAADVATGLGMPGAPERIEPAREPIDLDPSPALSILLSGPDSFEGRRLGVLVTNGADAKTLRSMRAAVTNVGAQMAHIAPTISGVVDSDGNELAVDEEIDGGPSVLFDAVALVLSADGADAHVHCKFVGLGPNAEVLLLAAGLDDSRRDAGYVDVGSTQKSSAAFVDALAALR